MLFFRVKPNLSYFGYILLIMLGNLDLKLLQRAFVDSDGIDYRADSSLRL